jgi:hypothetical protein
MPTSKTSGRQVKSNPTKGGQPFSISTAAAVGAVAIAALIPWKLGFFDGLQSKTAVTDLRGLPDKAQIIDQRSFNVLERVPPPSEADATTVWHLSQTSPKPILMNCRGLYGRVSRMSLS